MSTMREIDADVANLKIEWRGSSIWPLLRIFYFFQLRNIQNNADQKLTHDDWRKNLKRLLTLFKGLLNIFKRADYLIFSDSTENKVIKGGAQNKLLFVLFELLPERRFIYIEKPVTPKNSDFPLVNPNQMSSTLFDLLAFVIARLAPVRDVTGLEHCLALQRKYKLNINDQKIISLFRGYTLVLGLFLRWKSPRAIFLTDSYNLFHMAVSYCARQQQLPVVEFQHGVVNSEHPGYNIYLGQPKHEFSPTHFLTFSESVIAKLDTTCIFSRSQMFSVGHAYIDEMVKKQAEVCVQAKYTVGITLQWTDEDKVIRWIEQAALCLPEINFILLPRFPHLEKYHKPFSVKNMRYERTLNFYELLDQIHLHVTTYSTTALEAPIFGIPNLLIDDDGMASKYFGPVLTDSEVSCFVQDLESFIAQCRKQDIKARHEIQKRSQGLYDLGHKERLSRFLNQIF